MTPEEVRSRLIAFGEYTEDSVPSLEAISFLLERVEQKLESWLDFSPVLQEYTETHHSDEDGRIVLSRYPVVSLVSVELIDDFDVRSGVPLRKHHIASLWRQHNGIISDYRLRPIRVVYWAGYDPVPKNYAWALFEMLKRSLKNTGLSGDLSFLDAPLRDVQSLSISGISKSFRLGSKPADGDLTEVTELDRLMATFDLDTERRKYLW